VLAYTKRKCTYEFPPPPTTTTTTTNTRRIYDGENAVRKIRYEKNSDGQQTSTIHRRQFVIRMSDDDDDDDNDERVVGRRWLFDRELVFEYFQEGKQRNCRKTHIMYGNYLYARAANENYTSCRSHTHTSMYNT